jgi:hypothetical protein
MTSSGGATGLGKNRKEHFFRIVGYGAIVLLLDILWLSFTYLSRTGGSKTTGDTIRFGFSSMAKEKEEKGNEGLDPVWLLRRAFSKIASRRLSQSWQWPQPTFDSTLIFQAFVGVTLKFAQRHGV